MNQKKLEKEIEEIIGDAEYLVPTMIIEEEGVLWRFNKTWLKDTAKEITSFIKSQNQSLIKKILRKETALLNNIGDTIWAVTIEDIKKIREEVKK